MKDRKHIVLLAAYKILSPLIRVLLRYGISQLEFNELSKRIYLESSYKHFNIPGRKISASRVAILTGLSRREVVKLSRQFEDVSLEEHFKEPVNRASRVVCGWLQDKKFKGKNNKPLVLTMCGEKNSFEELVRLYSGNISFSAILDELLRIGAVKRIGDAQVKLVSEGYIPQASEIDSINVMGRSVADMLTSIEYNLTDPEHPRFQREVLYTNMSQSGMNEFKLVSRDKCNALLLDLNDWLGNKWNIEKELKLHEPNTKVGVGIYYIEETTSPGESNDVITKQLQQEV